MATAREVAPGGRFAPFARWRYRRRMRTPTPAAFAIILMALGGCADPEPYIYRSGEFDRGSVDFNRGPTDVANVDICYNRRVTTPAALQEMARAECAKYGKVARYTRAAF